MAEWWPVTAWAASRDPISNIEELDLHYLEEASDTGNFNENLNDPFLDNFSNHLPSYLGYAQRFAHEMFSSAPQDIFESFFTSAFKKGAFEVLKGSLDDLSEEGRLEILKSDDLLNVARCKLKMVDLPKDFKRLWPRYTPRRLEKYSEEANKILYRCMPFWARRFNKIWSRLTQAQAEVLRLEYFYEGDEKPTQKENAKKLGIQESSYKDRLEGAIKKVEKLYPEFERVRRRKSKPKTANFAERPKEKKLTSRERAEIKKWAYSAGVEEDGQEDLPSKRRELDFLALDTIFKLNR